MRFDPTLKAPLAVTMAAMAVTAAHNLWFGPRDPEDTPTDDQLGAAAVAALATEGYIVENPADVQAFVVERIEAKLADYRAQVARFGVVVRP